MMGRTSWQLLLALAAGAGLITYLVLSGLDGRGLLPVPVPALSGLGPATLAAVLLALGRNVRRMIKRQPTSMTPIGAARVVMLAKASALVGAALVGYFGAQLLLTLDNLAAPLPREQAWAAGFALVACLVLVGVALLVEWWCRVPPEDDDRKTARPSGAPTPA
ncbi:DUF3180 domain-containing protein [Georgenia yuyongxinii]|uniref:DUF3180 domain-containing protein n=1 Tax=Georgenia yuyongxinii TaxID=2589797 RepID=A0A5B8C6E8_9MICO|nr:DUF3180 domain-containing protein [Georgenia yuyongxinii]QDC26004.1 DUF3180 domain-containing protein [Georgenia yuyongxinii]